MERRDGNIYITESQPAGFVGGFTTAFGYTMGFVAAGFTVAIIGEIVRKKMAGDPPPRKEVEPKKEEKSLDKDEVNPLPGSTTIPIPPQINDFVMNLLREQILRQRADGLIPTITAETMAKVREYEKRAGLEAA